ncbi:hypothetical protein GCM10010329_31170 [Streptomyces spiroverticillatus]|uniref:Immunity protein 35 domain-containing protein n=1 Tax=Streptomyces finlayi TaxID=67296 RepID=A0A919C9C7_9ACTN|nr:YrhB domain-containing protein [Streptomyces finlayi]GHA06363.1 hypothetical protein GCM10010329_31170 [Streptomyces spiroverticillatus]GHC89972.1 hypothetical protein GCM10010334_23580 [Streptomyces finlayi]
MVDREEARRLVEAQLEREEPGQLVVTGVREHELVWIVSYQSVEYVRTGNTSTALVGNGPYLVDRVDAGLHMVGVLSARTGEWETDYRTRIRGMTLRTAVDDLHTELHRTPPARGRIVAMRLLRQRVPALTPAEAVAYVDGLCGGSVPAGLAAVVTEALVVPVPVCVLDVPTG